jgi:TolB-like protein/DNA-binding winged helix-turn-helix (wHTH) protein/Tfp pilus assembly protein PilF
MDLTLERGMVARFEGFELDSRSGELRFKGEKIPLQEKPLRILQRLVDRPGDVVTRDDLRQALWSADTFVDFDGGLNTAVNKLRTALGDSAAQPRFIETVGRRGYRFLARVETDPPGASGPDRPGEQPAVAPAGIAAGPARRARLMALVGGAAALAASVLAWQAWHSRSRADAPVIRSIAVLPLTNVSEKAEEEYFADGMTDALITDLAAVRSLRVISRQSVMRYKKSQKSLAEIGRELSVEALIEGTVLKSGDRVRVTAQLVHAQTDRHLWARSYERDIGDVVALQGELARAIVHEVRAEVASREQNPAATRRGASTPEAYDLYLRGRYFFNRRGMTNDEEFVEGLKKALGYLEQAIAKDPDFAQAHGALAEAYSLAGFKGVLPRAEVEPRVTAAIHHALALDPNLVEGHTALAGLLAFAQWDWVGGEREYTRALEIDPTYSNARMFYGFYLEAMGRYDEYLDHARRGLDVDPFNLLLNTAVAAALADLRRYDEAVAQYRRTLDLEPQFHLARNNLARLYSRMGRHEEAIEEAEKTGSRIGLAEVYALAGRRDEARRLLREFKALTADRYVSPLEVASVHVALGEKEQALAYLQGAFRARRTALSHLKVEPGLESLRSDPLFADLVRRMNLDTGAISR